jgi:hypothetical protein
MSDCKIREILFADRDQAEEVLVSWVVRNDVRVFAQDWDCSDGPEGEERVFFLVGIDEPNPTTDEQAAALAVLAE